MRQWPWDVLGIDQTGDEGAVRKAYADALRAIDLDKDVAAYADLRRARDEALWLARQGGEEDEGDFGLGSLDDEPADTGDLGFDPAPTPHDEGLDWSQHDKDKVRDTQFDAPPRDEPAQPELTEEQERARTAWNGLIEILYPDGQYSEEGITLEQLDEGNRYLAALIARSDQCEIEEHHALDHGLAQLMAETWPRSAPFVEPAAEAFHWLDESGQIEERPPLMFLNLRLRGMRFHEKVQQPDHPLNKAWVELSRPGRANFIDRMRVKREQVWQLLTGIRERYPEVESYLDPGRVASWENNEGSAGANTTIALLCFFGFIAFARVAQVFEDSSPPLPEAPYEAVLPSGPDNLAFDTRLAALFGDDIDLAAVREIDPVFADQLAEAKRAEEFGFRRNSIESLVRNRAWRVTSHAEFDELIALLELKRLWLGKALGSPEQCDNIRAGDFESIPLNLDSDDQAREAALLRKVLDAGLMGNLTVAGASNFNVPGWAVEDLIARTGLSEDQLAAALQDPDDARRCLVDYTLLEIVLQQPGRASVDLLRGL